MSSWWEKSGDQETGEIAIPGGPHRTPCALDSPYERRPQRHHALALQLKRGTLSDQCLSPSCHRPASLVRVLCPTCREPYEPPSGCTRETGESSIVLHRPQNLLQPEGLRGLQPDRV